MNVLVTGAAGFIGTALCKALAENAGRHVRGTTSSLRSNLCVPVPMVQVGKLSSSTAWAEALVEVDVVVHLAAQAHLSHGGAHNTAELERANVDGTLSLCHQASQAGARRFVFISSIGVNGLGNSNPFRANDKPNPAEPYAVSKWHAEQGLKEIQLSSDIEIVVIRPPLVYGPDAPGNFGSLVRWVEKGIPLPLGAIHNKRSLVGIDNLIDLISRCIDHPAAANQIFLAGDGEDVSTTELLRGVGEAMGKPARLIPVPASMLQLGANLLGKKAMAQRLLGSLQVDISKTCELLDWKPPYTVQEGLRRCFERSN